MVNKQRYLDWYIAEFKHPNVSVDKLVEEASISYQCLKHTEDLNSEREKLEALSDTYISSIESFAKFLVLEETYKLLD